MYCNFTTAADIGFEQNMYSVSERDGLLHPVIILNTSISRDITIEVNGRPGNATGSDYWGLSTQMQMIIHAKLTMGILLNPNENLQLLATLLWLQLSLPFRFIIQLDWKIFIYSELISFCLFFPFICKTLYILMNYTPCTNELYDYPMYLAMAFSPPTKVTNTSKSKSFNVNATSLHVIFVVWTGLYTNFMNIIS